MKETISKYGLEVTLDSNEIDLDNPGNGTPVLVKNKRGATATYWNALDTGELVYNSGRVYELSDKQWDFLLGLEERVLFFLDKYRGMLK